MQKSEVDHEKTHVVLAFNVFKKIIEIIINLNNNHLNYNITCIQNGPLETIDFGYIRRTFKRGFFLGD